MRRTVFTWMLTLLALAGATVAAADEKVSFEVKAPMVVARGEAVRVEFSLNAKPDEGSFAPPSFEGFDVIAGPAESQGSSIQIINGQMTRSSNYTITYVLLPQQEGNFTIDAATVRVGKSEYRTKPLPVEVVDEGKGGGEAERPAAGRSGDVQQQVAKDDILLRMILSRTTAFKGEPIRATLKLYYRVNLRGDGGSKFPSFNGFWAQEIEQEAQPQRERYNGKVYETQVVKEYLLYPQQSGELTVEPAELNVVAQVIVQSPNLDPFFGGGHEVYDVRRSLRTAPVKVTVRDLPAGAPESFGGAVGRFTMASNAPSTELTANSAATYTIKISGTGNLSFVQAPKLTLPGSFEQYNVKTTESMKTTAAGTTGYRQFEYPFIARAEGEYEIAPVEFTYFDPATKQYVTLSTARLPIVVAPDAGGGGAAQVVTGLSKEDVKLLGQDIRFIKLGRGNLRLQGRPFMGGTLYFVLLAAIVAAFAGAYVALRKRIRERRNAVLMRGKRANKVAVQRFRAAAGYMKQENRHAFYEEMLRALWGYMSDKFNIPVANLTKENVREELHKRGVAPELSQRFSEIISRCDEAQYSPLAGARMCDVYNEGVDFISKLESVIKK
ncbi:BatD family protein [Alistipes sp.]|uniref:BatD family protein n=1 Tax=Alistipes sp. TaxID=1872444 RepID=UPI003A853B30